MAALPPRPAPLYTKSGDRTRQGSSGLAPPCDAPRPVRVATTANRRSWIAGREARPRSALTWALRPAVPWSMLRDDRSGKPQFRHFRPECAREPPRLRPPTGGASSWPRYVQRRRGNRARHGVDSRLPRRSSHRARTSNSTLRILSSLEGSGLNPGLARNARTGALLERRPWGRSGNGQGRIGTTSASSVGPRWCDHVPVSM